MRKAALHNLGCKVNAYETEAMGQLLEEAGYELVPFREKADVYVINTCSVTNIADRKSRQMLHRARKQNPEAVVVAAGCYVQAAPEELKKDLAVDLIIGNNRKKDLVRILEEYFAGRENRKMGEESGQIEEKSTQIEGKSELTGVVSHQTREINRQSDEAGIRAEETIRREYVIDIGKTQEYEALHVSRIEEHTRAFIKVQDGCNQFCSYCIIPYTRGRVRSRRTEDVEQEVRQLAARGFREIVLTGIHLSSYGLDFADADSDGEPEPAITGGSKEGWSEKTEALRDGESEVARGGKPEKRDGVSADGDTDYLNRDAQGAGKGSQLLSLIRRLHGVEGIDRIRLGSLEPRIITEEFVTALAALPKICPHFHLSLQSGCDETLRRMNRHYTTAEYRERCDLLRKHFANPAITTDVIVGFPGETEEEFAVTKAFLEQIHFYEMHVFKYSMRNGTRAARMTDQIPESVKTVRSEELLALEKRMSLEYRRSFLGKPCPVLLEERMTWEGKEYLVGHTPEYVKVALAVLSEPGGGDAVACQERVPQDAEESKDVIVHQRSVPRDARGSRDAVARQESVPGRDDRSAGAAPAPGQVVLLTPQTLLNEEILLCETAPVYFEKKGLAETDKVG